MRLRLIKSFGIVVVLFVGLLLTNSCTPDTMLRPRADIARILRGRTWQRVFYVDTSQTNGIQVFEFKNTEVFITSTSKTGAILTIRYLYKFQSAGQHQYILIYQDGTRFDPFINGKWQILKLRKETLAGRGKKFTMQLARDGGTSDNNPFTIEGGLNMMEFVENE